MATPFAALNRSRPASLQNFEPTSPVGDSKFGEKQAQPRLNSKKSFLRLLPGKKSSRSSDGSFGNNGDLSPVRKEHSPPPTPVAQAMPVRPMIHTIQSEPYNLAMPRPPKPTHRASHAPPVPPLPTSQDKVPQLRPYSPAPRLDLRGFIEQHPAPAQHARTRSPPGARSPDSQSMYSLNSGVQSPTQSASTHRTSFFLEDEVSQLFSPQIALFRRAEDNRQSMFWRGLGLSDNSYDLRQRSGYQVLIAAATPKQLTRMAGHFGLSQAVTQLLLNQQVQCWQARDDRRHSQEVINVRRALGHIEESGQGNYAGEKISRFLLHALSLDLSGDALVRLSRAPVSLALSRRDVERLTRALPLGEAQQQLVLLYQAGYPNIARGHAAHTPSSDSSVYTHASA